ncbi:MAG TPA: hypothetical protein VE993_03210 [Stellaceae bacterium]|nr:hypothetical protein [Stellaceae bacterium]
MSDEQIADMASASRVPFGKLLIPLFFLRSGDFSPSYFATPDVVKYDIGNSDHRGIAAPHDRDPFDLKVRPGCESSANHTAGVANADDRLTNAKIIFEFSIG